MTWDIMLTLVAVHAAAVISPGPNMLSVMDSSINHGARSTIPFIFGILFGNIVHISYSIAMTSYAIAFSPVVRTTLAIVGGLYLGYAGLSRLRNSKVASYRTSTSNKFVSGFAVNITNPKGILLFVSIYSIVVPASVPLVIKISCGLWMLLVNFMFLTTLSVVISSKAAATVINGNLPTVNRFTGCMLIAISSALIYKSFSPG